MKNNFYYNNNKEKMYINDYNFKILFTTNNDLWYN